MLEMLSAGFSEMLTIYTMSLIFIGVAMGLVFGSIPGLTATMAVAICLPITFTMSPSDGMALLMGLYIGGVSGGLIPAILLKLPGTPSSISSTFDGYPMAQKGQAGKAFGLAIVFSFLGGLLSIATLILIAPPLAQFAVRFGPIEYFAITVFALTLISSLSDGSIVKGILAALIGISLAMVGSAPIDAFPRFTFGMNALDAGFNLLPALIGLFAISEFLKTSESKVNPLVKKISYKIKGFGFSVAEFFKQGWNFFRSAFIGIAIGILPGIGGGTANIIAYATAKNQSKHPEEFGKGTPEGVVASESSNNAAVGGALVPLMALGIPGDTVTAMLLGGLVIHGIQPGPLFFTSNTDIVYGIFAALIIANIAMLVFLFLGMRFFVKLLSIPKHILLPIILVLCVVGAFGVNNRLFDVWALLFFGVLGYLLIKLKFPLTPVILGFILGPIAETNLRRGLMQTQGDFLPFFTEPIAVFFFGVAIVSVGLKIWKNHRKKQTEINISGGV
ncbi:tripartite tricarboxylate transporter permease [Desertibacillus haloalkaliphilus]|uniref:tripartite tricarboxylate transporter permease n=1 Tax=Desertibacillus haloalkaliphilus TaxID=1328930 RepID=UPI001C26274C|nr:tripartite tricarboxylate transporter permease [Desertibacillus haloalkaliphilus]MBU8906471.1 tripartite tricarboxylate transporter permease [Desertibacillus haloalkaliphilus]